LTWLADDLGVIGRDQRVRTVDGKPCGSQTFAWPIMTRLQELLDYFQEHGQAMPANRRADAEIKRNAHDNARNGPSTAAAPPPWSPPPPPTNIQLETDDARVVWRKAMRFRALWEGPEQSTRDSVKHA
jgi:hypothetical protein